MVSNIEKFAIAIQKNFPKVHEEYKHCQCPICKGIVTINKCEYNGLFFAICTNCKMTLKG